MCSKEKGKEDKEGKTVVVEKQRLSKDELDMTRSGKTERKWRGGWEGMGHLGGRASDEKGIFSPRGQAVRVAWWHLLSHLSTVTLH